MRMEEFARSVALMQPIDAKIIKNAVVATAPHKVAPVGAVSDVEAFLLWIMDELRRRKWLPNDSILSSVLNFIEDLLVIEQTLSEWRAAMLEHKPQQIDPFYLAVRDRTRVRLGDHGSELDIATGEVYAMTDNEYWEMETLLLNLTTLYMTKHRILDTIRKEFEGGDHDDKKTDQA